MNVSLTEPKKRKYTFFGAAMFLRPTLLEQRTLVQNYDAKKIAACAREKPHEWECLLMKRNYLDFSWDHIGGHNEINEFPSQTMIREVQEEVGWNVKDYMEVCRQWKNGFLNGFVYLVIPEQPNFMSDTPPRVPCDEVQTVEYFNLLHLLKSEQFKPNVKGRIQAFISNKSDFTLQ